MARIEIQGLRIVDATIEKLWEHGIGDDQVTAVLNHEWITTRNRRQRAASHVLIGTQITRAGVLLFPLLLPRIR